MTGIKKRTVKARKIRRPDDISLAYVQEMSSPGAGPSRSRSRSVSPEHKGGRSRSPTSRRLQSNDETADNSIDRTPSGAATPRPRRRLTRRSHLAPPRSAHPPLLPCRSVYSYTRLNHIEEGTYGVVFRARCNDTNQIFALKKLKLEEEKQGFPITSLREVMALMVAGEHPNVVGIREIVVGETLNQ